MEQFLFPEEKYKKWKNQYSTLIILHFYFSILTINAERRTSWNKLKTYFANVTWLANFVLIKLWADLDEFKRSIVVYKNHFWDFYNRQDEKVKSKIDWTVTMIQTTRIVPEKFLKHLTNSDGLWEVRVSANNGIFRIFCFFDKGNLIVPVSYTNLW